MKKLLFLLVALGLGVFITLATIDLRPYLEPSSGRSSVEVAIIPQEKFTETIAAPPELLTKDQLSPQQPESQPAQSISNLESQTSEPAIIVTESNTPAVTPHPVNNEHLQAPQELAQNDTIDTQNSDSDDKISLSLLTKSQDELFEILPEGEYPFSILLETFDALDTAQKSISIYEKRGISAYWVKVDLGTKGIKYRLFTGFFPTTGSAQLFLDKHQIKAKPIKATYHAALLGSFRDLGKLNKLSLQTRKTGVVPYILSTAQGTAFLYVGAFYTYAGANAQCSELRKSGLPCTTVKRSTITR